MEKTIIQKQTEDDELLWRHFDEHCKSLGISWGAGLRNIEEDHKDEIRRAVGSIRNLVDGMWDENL